MTREEAIKQLRLLKGDITFGIASKVENKNQIEALSIAIASLETDEAYDLEYEQPKFCKDCISREAVYYYISSHIHEIITESGTDKNAHTNAILRSLANGVKTMPSVLHKVTKNDLGADREDAVERLNALKQLIGYDKDSEIVKATQKSLDMAISALEHPERNVIAVVPCGDAISRSDVLKLMQDNWHTHNGDWAMQESMDDIRALPSVTPQEPRVDFKELKRKILSEVDGGTDDAWLAYGEVCERISNSIDEYVQNIKALPSVEPIRPKGHWTEEFNDLEGEVRFTCSSCGNYQLFGTDFCYHCGSDNREVENE